MCTAQSHCRPFHKYIFVYLVISLVIIISSAFPRNIGSSYRSIQVTNYLCTYAPIIQSRHYSLSLFAVKIPVENDQLVGDIDNYESDISNKKKDTTSSASNLAAEREAAIKELNNLHNRQRFSRDALVNSTIVLFESRVDFKPWSLADSFNSTTLKALFDIKDEILSFWGKFERSVQSAQLQIFSKVQNDIKMTVMTGEYVSRVASREVEKVISGAEMLSRPILSLPTTMQDISSISNRTDTWSLLRMGINPIEKPKLLGRFSSSSAQQKKRQQSSSLLSAESLYKNARSLPNRLSYDYDRRRIRQEVNANTKELSSVFDISPARIRNFLIDRAASSSTIADDNRFTLPSSSAIDSSDVRMNIREFPIPYTDPYSSSVPLTSIRKEQLSSLQPDSVRIVVKKHKKPTLNRESMYTNRNVSSIVDSYNNHNSSNNINDNSNSSSSLNIGNIDDEWSPGRIIRPKIEMNHDEVGHDNSLLSKNNYENSHDVNDGSYDQLQQPLIFDSEVVSGEISPRRGINNFERTGEHYSHDDEDDDDDDDDYFEQELWNDKYLSASDEEKEEIIDVIRSQEKLSSFIDNSNSYTKSKSNIKNSKVIDTTAAISQDIQPSAKAFIFLLTSIDVSLFLLESFLKAIGPLLADGGELAMRRARETMQDSEPVHLMQKAAVAISDGAEKGRSQKQAWALLRALKKWF